ncbi:MAG: hypothetical protein EXR18_04650 [Flavobacteriaceae bacterium]|nr:hypothetical protein [Flavobacteriaceae bacterium]
MRHNIIVITLFLFSLTGFGCQEQLTKVEDTTSFEKRTPIGVKDSVKITKRIPIESVLPCLNLSQEQMDKIKFILKESRTCEMECKLKLKTTMESLRKQQAEKLAQYKGFERDSLVRQQVELIKKEYAKLAKETQLVFQVNMKKCNETTLSLIEGLLTEEQLVIFNKWKLTGQLPCERKKS